MALSSRELILILRARDEASRVFHGLAKNINGLSGAAAAAAQASYAHGQALVTSGVAIAAVGAGAIVVLNDMADAAANYNTETAKTLTQVDGVKLSLEDLKRMGRDVGREMPVDFKQVQGALYDIFSSIDTDGPGAATLLRGIGKAAVAGSVDMEVAGRTNIAILNAWKMKATDVNHVNDVMFQLVRKGVGTYDQFGKSIGRAIPSAIRAGQSVESLAGMMAFLTRNGLSTSMSATSAARALDAMSNPKTVANFDKWGVSITDAKGKFRPMVDIISDMKVKLEKLSPVAKSAKLQELFKGSGGTIQAMRFLNLALGDSTGLYQQLTKDMNNAGGAADKAYKIMAATPAARIQAMNNQWEILKTVLGDYVLPIKLKIVDVLGQIFNWFNKLSPTTQKWLVIITMVGAALLIVIGVVTAAVGLFMMMSAAATLAGTSLLAISGIGALIVAAIVAIVAAGYLVVKNWDLIKAKAAAVWNNIWPVINAVWMAIENFAKRVWDTLKTIWEVIGPQVKAGWDEIMAAIGGVVTKLAPYWQMLVDAWDNLRSKAASVSVGITDWMSRIWTVLQPIVYLIAGALQVLWTTFTKVFSAVADAVGSFVGNVIQILSGLINFFTAVFTGDWEAAWQAILQILQGVWGAISSVIVGARDIIWGVVEGFIGGIIGFFQHLWDVLVGHSIIPDLMNAIIHWFVVMPIQVLRSIGSFISDAIGKFINLASRVISIVAGWVRDMIGRFMDVMSRIGRTVSGGVTSTVSFFATLPWKVITAVGPLINKLLTAAGQWMSNILRGVRNGWAAIGNFFSGLPRRIMNTLGNLGSLLYNAGMNILQGLLNGLRDKWHDIQNFVGGIGSWIADHKGPKDYDLRLLKPAGGWIMKGLRDGLKEAVPALRSDLNGLANMISSTPFGAPPVGLGVGTGAPDGAAFAGAGGTSVQIPITVNTQEIDPVKHSADLGYEIAGRLGL
jgi:trimeric autotransporter adhesin